MIYIAEHRFGATSPQTQMDWVDAVSAVETWLEQYVGQRGTDWDYYGYTDCQQIQFKRDRDCVWFKLAFSQ